MTRKYLTSQVDELGNLIAEVAETNTKIKALKTAMIRTGKTEIDGELFRVTIASSIRNLLDMGAVRAKLTPQFIRSHTNTSKSVTVKCVARLQNTA